MTNCDFINSMFLCDIAQICIISILELSDLNEKKIGEIKYNYWLFALEILKVRDAKEIIII